MQISMYMYIIPVLDFLKDNEWHFKEINKMGMMHSMFKISSLWPLGQNKEKQPIFSYFLWRLNCGGVEIS